MKISNEAIEAAAWTIYKAMHPDHAASGLGQVGGPIRAYCIDVAHAALEAAAPFIRAETLESAADALDGPLIELRQAQGKSFDWLCGIADAEDSIRARAAEMRQG